MQQKEAELAQVEQLLTYYEQTLDEIETRLDSQEETPSYTAILCQRLLASDANTHVFAEPDRLNANLPNTPFAHSSGALKPYTPGKI